MHKLTTDELAAPAGAWIAVGDAQGGGEGAVTGPARAEGRCGEMRWSLRFGSQEAELRHLPRGWLYRAPLPRTKATSPLPAATFDGVVELAGREAIELRSWPGMVGHNWGSEHAERWIWLHGVGFEGAPSAWLDVVLGRVRVAGRLTPWVANGALSIDGRRHRVGGLFSRGLRLAERADECEFAIPGQGGLSLEGSVRVPPQAAAGWRYADPDGGGHDVVNCSVSALELTLRGGGGETARRLATPHGAAYELGMRERDHGVPIAPFADG